MLTPRILKSPKFVFFFTFLVIFLCHYINPNITSAQDQPESILNLPKPGTLVKFSESYTPTLIKGITINPQNALEFDFIIDKGDSGLMGEEFTREANKLVKYFMAALTVPEAELWVNLSPHENDRIIPDNLGITDMGRDLLSQDYLLKQLTASLMYPKDEIGQTFWDHVHKKAQELYGTTEIPMNTFNKIWIIPEKATVLEHEGTAYVVESELKVMLEEDYMTMQAEKGEEAVVKDNSPDKESTEITSQVVREVLLPEIEKEINTGKTFANLRQINNAIILAEWYKRTLKESLLGQVYIDKNKVAGVDLTDKNVKDKIFDQYVRSFIKGAFNMVQEDYDKKSQTTVFRKYFSGGADFSAYRSQPDTLRIVSAGETVQAGREAIDRQATIEDVTRDIQSRSAPRVQDSGVVKVKVALHEVDRAARLSDTNRESPIVLRNLPRSQAELTSRVTAAAFQAASSGGWNRIPSLSAEQEQVQVNLIQQTGIRVDQNTLMDASGRTRLRTTGSGEVILEYDTGLGFEALPESVKVQQRTAVARALSIIESSGVSPTQIQTAVRQASQDVISNRPISPEVRSTSAGSRAIEAAESMLRAGVVTGSDIKAGQSFENQSFAVQARALRAVDTALQVQTGQSAAPLAPGLASQTTAAAVSIGTPADQQWVPFRAETPERTNILARQIQDSGTQQGPNIRQLGSMRLRTTDTGESILEFDRNAGFESLPEPARLQQQTGVSRALTSVQTSGIASNQILSATRQATQAGDRGQAITTDFTSTPVGSAVVQAADDLIRSGVVTGTDVRAGQPLLNQSPAVQARAFRTLETALQVQAGQATPTTTLTARVSQATSAAVHSAAPAERWTALTNLTDQEAQAITTDIQQNGVSTVDTNIRLSRSGTLRARTTETGRAVIEIDSSSGYQSLPTDIRTRQENAVKVALDQIRTSPASEKDVQIAARRAMRTVEQGEPISQEFARSPAGSATVAAAETVFNAGVVTGSDVQANQPLLRQPYSVQTRAFRAVDTIVDVQSGNQTTDRITTASSAAAEAHFHVLSASSAASEWIPVQLPQSESTALVQNIRSSGTSLASGYTYAPNAMTRVSSAGVIEVRSTAPAESLPPSIQAQYTQGMRNVSNMLQNALDQERLDSRTVQSRLSNITRQTQRGETITADFGATTGTDRVIRDAAQQIIDSGITTPANIRPGTPLSNLSARDQTVVLGALDRGLQEFRRAEVNESTKGGIDLNPDMLDFQIKRDGKGVPLPVIQQPLDSFNIEGFIPVIIDIAPLTNIPRL